NQCPTYWCSPGGPRALMGCAHRGPHSMTSSVPARIEGGTVRPSALAVLRLTTSSNRHRAGEKNYEIASPHARPLALTASRDYGSKGPPRIGWAKGSFHPEPTPSVVSSSRFYPLAKMRLIASLAARGVQLWAFPPSRLMR